MKQKEIYIAGPMSGHPNLNYAAFFAAEKKYRADGWKVWNPASKDEQGMIALMPGFATGNDKEILAHGWDFREAYLWDIEKVIKSDAIYMLKGWQKSSGAIGEHATAVAIKQRYPDYEIIYEDEKEMDFYPRLRNTILY